MPLIAHDACCPSLCTRHALPPFVFQVALFWVRGVALPFLVATRDVQCGGTLWRNYGDAWWQQVREVQAGCGNTCHLMKNAFSVATDCT